MATVEPQEGRGRRKVRIGTVVSSKADKSIVVQVEWRVPHPLYRKYYKRTTKLMAHDAKNEASVGDTVKIMETRPLSRLKRWWLVRIVKRVK